MKFHLTDPVMSALGWDSGELPVGVKAAGINRWGMWYEAGAGVVESLIKRLDDLKRAPAADLTGARKAACRRAADKLRRLLTEPA
jgi:hypothetical protein